MELIPIKSPLIKPGGFYKTLIKLLSGQKIENGDVLALASKVIAIEQNDLVVIDKIKVGNRASSLAKKYQMTAPFVQLVIEQADKIIGGVKGTLLTEINGLVIANAGIDHSNSPKNHYILWPKNPTQAAAKVQKIIKDKFSKKVGIILVDSHCQPRRLGTSGLALAISGWQGVIDQRKKKDLYGQTLKITFSNLADDLAAASSSLMGEAAEKTPLVLIKQAPIKLSDKSAKQLTGELKMNRGACLFSGSDL
ncbi:coenzyme F420-0:L-glutamate ligase [Patescibacteria group bacterium]|nr:coenzyme F420-0:L-glutamate ligase [Patescibacteria group bacterium]